MFLTGYKLVTGTINIIKIYSIFPRIFSRSNYKLLFKNRNRYDHNSEKYYQDYLERKMIDGDLAEENIREMKSYAQHTIKRKLRLKQKDPFEQKLGIINCGLNKKFNDIIFHADQDRV